MQSPFEKRGQGDLFFKRFQNKTGLAGKRDASPDWKEGIAALSFNMRTILPDPSDRFERSDGFLKASNEFSEQ